MAAQESHGQFLRQACLTHTAWPSEEIGMGHAAAQPGAGKQMKRPVLAENGKGLHTAIPVTLQP